MAATITTRAEVIEAEIRRKMAEHARIEPRGFNTERERLWLREDIDRLYDELAAL